MIKYSLVCQDGHEFDAWFKNSAEFEPQAERGDIACPTCASTHVGKALMAPRLSTRGGRDGSEDAERRRAVFGQLAKLRQAVLANSEDVGARFADEARKIHYEEADARAIHGEATSEDALALGEEGIAILPLPRLPEDQN